MVRLRCGGLAGQWAVEGTQRGDLVDRGEGVEGAGIADERQQLGHDVHEQCAVVADVAVGGDVSADLAVGTAEADEQGEGDQLTGRDVQPGAGVVVAEAVRRQEPRDVLGVGRSVRVQGRDPLRSDDLLLDGTPRSVSTSFVACRKS